MKVDLGATIHPAKAADLARAAEGAGYDALWAAETNHDPFLACALAAASTDSIEIGTGIAIAFARTPMTLASTAHDLQGLSSGRFVLGLGSQIKPHIEHRYSMPWSEPARRMREFVLALRAIWDTWERGTPLTFEGDFYRHTLMTPMFTPRPHGCGDPKVFLAGVGPRMTEVAGEVADGLICHGFSSERYLRERTLPALRRGCERAGRDPDDVEVVAPGFVVTGVDDAAIEAAAAATRRQIAFYGSTPAYRPVLELHGWGDLQPELHALSKRGEWDSMGALISDEVLETFAVVGRPEEVGAELHRRLRRRHQPGDQLRAPASGCRHQRLVVSGRRPPPTRTRDRGTTGMTDEHVTRTTRPGAPHRMVKWSPPYRKENVELPEFDLVDIERDGPIGRIILNSPEKRNPLGYERLLQLEMAAKWLELDEDIRVIIIKGAGPSFSAGYDMTPVKKGERQRNMPQGGYIHPERDRLWQSYDLEHARVYLTLFDLQKPVIAQIHGHCLAGGTELAGFCDLRVVADDAKIGWPVGRNWSPGNLQYIPWLVGMTKSKYYMFTCEPMTGVEAAACQWASESVPADRLEARTEELAQQIALTPTDLLMLTKRSINRQFEIMGFRTGIAASVDILALSSFREQGLYAARDPETGEAGDEFMKRAERDGLKAAMAWREETFGNQYRAGDGDA